jgi:hypothetical protein
VRKNRKIKGVASGSYDENNKFVGNKNLTLTMNFLTYVGLSDFCYAENNSCSLPTSIGSSTNKQETNRDVNNSQEITKNQTTGTLRGTMLINKQ